MANAEKIFNRLHEHYNEATKIFPSHQIVGIFLQGSQNYEMDYKGSDIDTKLLVCPSFEDIVLNRTPKSYTHVFENDEHMDVKDIRLYWQTLRKGNINFVEILFTKYCIINPLYIGPWLRVDEIAEDIAFMNPLRAVAAMMGTINEKYHALTHRYPSRVEVIDKFGGYDPKQLHHLVRVTNFLKGYIYGGYPYRELITADNVTYETKAWVKELKYKGFGSLESALDLANATLEKAREYHSFAKETLSGEENPTVSAEMDSILTEIIKITIKEDIA